ncbi:hypothetical protein BTJ_3311 [Burkholderia thailandensis E444]|nr:hypothetical protein BTJ_3311 [Burkholderia thailandensis E444]KGS96379.1 hypothetical protein X963_6212 [Burkholderia pseudomallei MSHR7498]
MHGLFWLQVMTVAQQQPATGLQNLAGRLVMSQLVGLIHPYPIDHLATVLGHDVVQVKDDFRLRALFLDLQLIGRGHVDCDRFDALGHAFGELFEEGARRLA